MGICFAPENNQYHEQKDMDPFIKPYFVLPTDLWKLCSRDTEQSGYKQKPNGSKNNC